MRLVIDDREQQIIPFFNKSYKDIEIIVKRINIGDYAIYDGTKILFIIERKTWKDLASSIRDERKNNIDKLLLARKKTSCKILYLIEGKARYNPMKKFCRISYKNLQSHLDHLMIRDDISIIYSINPEDTSNRLIEFIYNFISLDTKIKKLKKEINEEIDEEVKEEVKEELNSVDILSHKFIKSDINIIYSIWRCIPGITDKTTDIFIKDYHISDIILGNISKEVIYNMKYPNGTIIGKRSEKIYNICKKPPETFNIFCNMLTCINGVTKKTAAIILTKYGITDIVLNKVDVNTLAILKKTEKMKLGLKVAENIIKFFVKPKFYEIQK